MRLAPASPTLLAKQVDDPPGRTGLVDHRALPVRDGDDLGAARFEECGAGEGVAKDRERSPESAMEKEQQLALFADRTSRSKWWTNHYRVLLAALAYTLLET